ncbi:glycosyltransferase family 4 protein [uncultured Stenotrophomonas sp.]|uniref:glycosyltransferase family 4 protein n=1 Tax=uncultured Stenotrophomonas sp. TaxID=165438 RepID=UPI0025ED4681|nr:glycosyltransferase family 4 protein [uncultured Stenotrophomonas sp.]
MAMPQIKLVKRITYLANLFPSEAKPAFGTFVKTSCDGLTGLGWMTDVIALPSFGGGVKGYARFYASAFLSLCRQQQPVYVHYVSHSAPPAILAKLFNWKLPIILHYHGSDGFPEVDERSVRRLMKRAVCSVSNSLAAAIIAPSDSFLERLRAHYALDGKTTFVSASGGVDASVFYGDPASERAVDLLFAGRMIPGKGGIEAALAARDVLYTRSDATALFVGTGPERARMEEILTDYIPSGRARFLPALPQPALADLYRECKVFLFPSSRQGESLGLTWVEAAMCGALPLVLRNGITENLLPAQLADTLSAPCPEQLGTKALAFLDDASARRLAAGELQSAVAHNYSSEHVSAALDAFLTQTFCTTR